DMLVSSKGESREAISAVDENEFIVDEAELDRALENLPLLLTQARAVPYFADGQAVGLRLFAIKSGSLYEKIGLRNGDVLKSVNGNSMADLSQAMQLFEKLKTERSINLTIERNREEKEFKYQIR
ncbi:MAG: ral secretion pathway protein, partial [Pseudomonadota bacterium]